MRILKKYYLLSVFSVLFVACDLLEPVDDNHSTDERLKNDAAYAEGLLVQAYNCVPNNTLHATEVATDNAVTNVKTNSYLRMATGRWSAMYNPVNQWSNCISGIQYLNQFLPLIDEVNWKRSMPEVHEMYIKRFKGEVYALRALLQYHLLVSVAGEGADGRMLGIPAFEIFLDKDANFNTPRETFDESIRRIHADIDKSLEYLTMDDYRNISSESDLPPGYGKDMIGTDNSGKPEFSNYNIVFGNETKQRISGRIIKALRARVALLAASPAFNPNNDAALWVQTANYAGAVLDGIGGISGLDPDGHRFYLKSQVDKLNITASTPVDQKEMLWRRPYGDSNDREISNFPPSLYGAAQYNPTHNLVNAFPMKNGGYPVSDASSGYDATDPYAGRDDRLALYIMVNGSTYKGETIRTGVGGGVNAKDSIETSTRTGYYLKKMLVEEVVANPTGQTTARHYNVYMRYTEFFLIYAEAANEAWGPDGTGTYGFSARDVIRAIRNRAGINLDNYIDAITTREDMRELIRNERRLELCFEGFRFWDLRRWKLDLTEPAKGVNISRSNEYTIVDVEPRAYLDYMIYGPIPYTETLKYNALIQNKGW